MKGLHMSLLSRTEEIILLNIWRLKDNAYGVSIADNLTETTGKKWRIGAMYVPLERLERKGYLTSYLGNSTNKRGGRSKRLYKLTKTGIDALIETRNMEEQIWTDISVNNLESGYES
jgi:DNA-binding PadR family transcriptional regulator